MKDIQESQLETNQLQSPVSIEDRQATGKAAQNQIDTVNEKAFLRFLLCFMRIQNILYTKIGVDELNTLAKRQISLFKEFLNYSAGSEASKAEQVKKLIYVSIILIFIAHATIHDAQSTAKSMNEDLSIKETLDYAFK